MASIHGPNKIITPRCLYREVSRSEGTPLDQPADRLAAWCNRLPDGIFVTYHRHPARRVSCTSRPTCRYRHNRCYTQPPRPESPKPFDSFAPLLITPMRIWLAQIRAGSARQRSRCRLTKYVIISSCVDAWSPTDQLSATDAAVCLQCYMSNRPTYSRPSKSVIRANPTTPHAHAIISIVRNVTRPRSNLKSLPLHKSCT